jgi:hypothetical protein
VFDSIELVACLFGLSAITEQKSKKKIEDPNEKLQGKSNGTKLVIGDRRSSTRQQAHRSKHSSTSTQKQAHRSKRSASDGVS